MRRYDLSEQDKPTLDPDFLRLTETAMLLSLLNKGMLTRRQFERCFLLRGLGGPHDPAT